MPGQTFDQIVSYFDNHIKVSGKRFYSDFYVGITDNVSRCLFIDHNVNRETMWWAYSTATTKEVAEQVRKHYIDKGMRGNAGGGTLASKIVYCYAVSPTTVDREFQNA